MEAGETAARFRRHFLFIRISIVDLNLTFLRKLIDIGT